MTAGHAGPDHRATPDETPPQPVFIAMDMHFSPAAAHPLPPECPAPPPHAVVLRGVDVTGGSLPASLVDTCGGVTLCLPEAVSAVLDTPGLQYVDLLDCPRLVSVDLRALGGGIHLTVRGCPGLTEVRLADHGGAIVHVDAGAAPPRALSVHGSVAQFDACWGRDGRFMRQARRGTAFLGMHVGTEAPRPPRDDSALTHDLAILLKAFPIGQEGTEAHALPPDLVILIHARPDDARTGELTLGPGLEGCRDVCLIEPDDALLALQWTGSALREFAVEGARGLMVLRLPARVDHLLLSHCPRLRAVTTEGDEAGAVTLRECCTVDPARAPGGRAASTRERPAPGAPRVRPSLVVDVPCAALALLDCGFESLRVFHSTVLHLARCHRLLRARVDPSTEVHCEGSPPWSLLDHISPMSPGVAIQEGLVARLRDDVLQSRHGAWPRFVRVLDWKLSRHACVTALQALCAMLDGGRHATPDHRATGIAIPRDELWNARWLLYHAQTVAEFGSDFEHWAWVFPPDLMEDGFRSDFRLWAACRSGEDAQAEARSMALGLLQGQNLAAAQALLPWLARNPTPQSLPLLTDVLRRAADSPTLPSTVLSVGGALIRPLIRLFTPGTSATTGTSAGTGGGSGAATGTATGADQSADQSADQGADQGAVTLAAPSPTHPRDIAPDLFDAAHDFYTECAEASDQLHWLAFEMRHDRAGTRTRIAQMLRHPTRDHGPRHRTALTALMLTGTLPASTRPRRAA